MTVSPSHPVAVCLSVVILLGACSDTPGPWELVSLQPILRPDRESPELLLPQAVTEIEDHHLVVLEVGRRTLTILDDQGQLVERRHLWTDSTLGDFVTGGADEVGRTIVQRETGLWVVVRGVGPVFLGRDTKPSVLGAGVNGEPPRSGVVTRDADLTAVAAIADDGSGALLIGIESDIFRVGESLSRVESTVVPDPGEAGGDDEPLTLFQVSALAVDEAGNIYACDSGTGWIWIITPGGDAALLSGRGDRLSIPADPIPAAEAAVDLVYPVLQWDPFRHELLLLANASLYAIDVGWPETPPPEGATIRAIPNTPAQAAGVTATEAGLVVSSLLGSIVALEEGAQRTLVAANTGELDLGRADAIEAVGLGSFAYRDMGQHRWSIYIGGLGSFPWLESGYAGLPPPRLMAGDSHANVYYSTGFDLRHIELNVGFRTLGTRVPAPVFDGQLISEYELPTTGELRVSGNSFWLLDETFRILLRFDSVTGELEHVAGAVNGGGIPSTSYQPRNLSLTLTAPRSLEPIEGTVVLVDDIHERSVVLATNPTEEERSIAGALVKPGRTALLGGSGDMAYEAGLDFADVGLHDIRSIVFVDEALYLAVDDDAAPALISVDSAGVVADAIWAPESPPDAMTVAEPSVLLLGWAGGSAVYALNIGADTTDVLGTDVSVGSALQIAEVTGGVRSFAVSQTGRFFALQTDDAVVELDSPSSSLAQAPHTSTNLAITPEGGLLAVADGAIWGVDTTGDAEFLGETMPAPPGEVIVTGPDEWISGWPISTLPFGDNLSAVAIAPSGDLFFVDWEIRALFRSEVSDDGAVLPNSPTHLESRGVPIPADPNPIALAVDEEQRVYMATASRVFRFHEQSWAVLAGSDVDGLPNADQKSDRELRSISGIEVFGDDLFVRSREGLFVLGHDGHVESITPSLGTPTLDPGLLLNMQSFSIVDDTPVVLIGGEVHRLTSSFR